ncbi:MAG: VTT domain-containing protein [Patescibacteria group bacterium]
MFDLPVLIKTFGYAGVFFAVFAESGLFIGFFLPGDSLLFTAGFLASQGFGNILILAAGSFAAAVLGDSAGYAFGKKIGPRLFSRPRSRLFRPEHARRAREFYSRHGGKALILARFMPVVRTFVPILAGVGEMRYPAFFFYNVAGGFLWAVGLSVSGYALGSIVPDADRYIVPIVIFIIALSITPPMVHWMRERKKN